MLRPLRSVWKKSSPVLMEPQQIRKSCERPRVPSRFFRPVKTGRRLEAKGTAHFSSSGIVDWIKIHSFQSIRFENCEADPARDRLCNYFSMGCGPNHNSQPTKHQKMRKEKNRTTGRWEECPTIRYLSHFSWQHGRHNSVRRGSSPLCHNDRRIHDWMA